MRGSIYPREETIIEELKGHRSFRFEPCALSFKSKDWVNKFRECRKNRGNNPSLPTQNLAV